MILDLLYIFVQQVHTFVAQTPLSSTCCVFVVQFAAQQAVQETHRKSKVHNFTADPQQAEQVHVYKLPDACNTFTPAYVNTVQ